MKFLLLLLISFVFSVQALTFKNKPCKDGACQFQATKIEFSGYDLKVTGTNTGGAIPGGEVKLDVWIKIIFWVSAYSSTDPTCSYKGTDCSTDGILVGPKSQKTLTLSMDGQTPPSGTYRGTALFYHLNPEDTSNVEYSNIEMNWQCNDNSCY